MRTSTAPYVSFLGSLLSLSLGCGLPDSGGLRGGPVTEVASLCTTQLMLEALDAINSTGPVPADCTKLEGGQIGALPQTLLVGGVRVEIVSWTEKAGEGDSVGFELRSSGPVVYAVKAGTRTFAGSTSRWVHPDGTSGPNAKGISNITFCPGGGGGAGGASDGGLGGDGGGFEESGGIGSGSGSAGDAGTSGGAGDGECTGVVPPGSQPVADAGSGGAPELN